MMNCLSFPTLPFLPSCSAVLLHIFTVSPSFVHLRYPFPALFLSLPPSLSLSSPPPSSHQLPAHLPWTSPVPRAWTCWHVPVLLWHVLSHVTFPPPPLPRTHLSYILSISFLFLCCVSQSNPCHSPSCSQPRHCFSQFSFDRCDVLHPFSPFL